MTIELTRKPASATNGGEFDASLAQTVPVTTLLARNTSGITFKNVGTTTVGTISDTGAWTLGDASNSSFPGNLLVSRKDGSSVPSGYIGQVVRSADTANWATYPTTPGAGSFSNSISLVPSGVCTVTLPPGIWHISLLAHFWNNAVGVGNLSTIFLGLSTDSGTFTWSDATELGQVGETGIYIACQELAGGGTRLVSGIFNTTKVITTTTTYYAKTGRDCTGVSANLAVKPRITAVLIG